MPHTGGNQIVMQKRGTFSGLEYLKSSHMVRPCLPLPAVARLFVTSAADELSMTGPPQAVWKGHEATSHSKTQALSSFAA